MKSFVVGIILALASCSASQAFALKTNNAAPSVLSRSTNILKPTTQVISRSSPILFSSVAADVPPTPEAKTTSSKISTLQGLTFLFILSSSLTALAPPPALVAKLGAEKATALLSMVSGTGALTEIMFATAVGSAIDRTGRKPALVLTVLAMAAANGAVAVQSTVPALCVSKFVNMLCVGFFTLTTQAMISDLCMAPVVSADKGAVDTDKLVSSALGMQMALTGLGFLFGILGAGLLSDKLGLSAIYGASATIATLTALGITAVMPETLTQRTSKGTKLISWKKLLTSPIASAKLLYSYGPQVRTLAILLVLMSFPSNQGDFLQIYAKTEWGLSTKLFSSYLALVGMVGIFANGFGSQLVKKMGVKKFTSIAIISRCITAAGTAFFGYRGSVIGWIVGFLGAAQSIGIVAALVSAGAKSGLPQGELAGERSSLLALLKVVGPIWYSMLYIQGSSRFGLNNFPFLFNVGLCGIAFIVAQTCLKGGDEAQKTV